MCPALLTWLLDVVVGLLFIANTINIGADLGAVAERRDRLLIGGRIGIVYVLLYGITRWRRRISLDYRRYVWC